MDINNFLSKYLLHGKRCSCSQYLTALRLSSKDKMIIHCNYQIALYSYLTGRCLVQRRRPASRCSNSPAEATPRWPGSGTGSAAGRSSAVEAAAGDTSGFYTVPLHCCNLGSRIQVIITCHNLDFYELHCSQHLQLALITFIRTVINLLHSMLLQMLPFTVFGESV